MSDDNDEYGCVDYIHGSSDSLISAGVSLVRVIDGINGLINTLWLLVSIFNKINIGK
jgi:hypothetical protein